MEFDGGDGDAQDDEPSGYGEGDFIRMDGGRTFIRKFEIVALRWEQYLTDDDAFAWRLKVFFSDCPHSIVYGEEAADILRSFGLPDEYPLR